MRTSEPLVPTFRGKVYNLFVYNLLRLGRSGIGFQPIRLASFIGKDADAAGFRVRAMGAQLDLFQHCMDTGKPIQLPGQIGSVAWVCSGVASSSAM